MWHAEACRTARNSIDFRFMSSSVQLILTTSDGAAHFRGIRNSNPMLQHFRKTFLQNIKFRKTFLQNIKFRKGLRDHSQHLINLSNSQHMLK
jgi:hypothetical protein